MPDFGVAVGDHVFLAADGRVVDEFYAKGLSTFSILYFPFPSKSAYSHDHEIAFKKENIQRISGDGSLASRHCALPSERGVY